METSPLEVIHRDTVSTLSFDASVPCSLIVWHGFASSADFRATCLRGLDLMRERRFSKGISDARNLRIISLADQQWFTEEYVPMVLELGLSPVLYSAVVLPKDFFGRQSLDQIVEQVDEVMTQTTYQDQRIRTEYFEDYAAARAWLLSVDSVDAAPHAATDAATDTAAADQSSCAETV